MKSITENTLAAISAAMACGVTPATEGGGNRADSSAFWLKAMVPF